MRGASGDDLLRAGIEPERSKKARWRKAVSEKNFHRCPDCGALFIDATTMIEHAVKRHQPYDR